MFWRLWRGNRGCLKFESVNTLPCLHLGHLFEKALSDSLCFLSYHICSLQDIHTVYSRVHDRVILNEKEACPLKKLARLLCHWNTCYQRVLHLKEDDKSMLAMQTTYSEQCVSIVQWWFGRQSRLTGQEMVCPRSWTLLPKWVCSAVCNYHYWHQLSYLSNKSSK